MKSILFLSIVSCLSLHAQTVLVKPYVQPGDGATLTGSDVKVITWLTDPTPGKFTVEFSVKGGPVKSATVDSVALDFGMPAKKPATAAPAGKPGDLPKATPPKPEPALTLEEMKDKTIETFPALKEREQHYLRHRAVLADLPFDSEVQWTVKNGASIVRQGSVKTRATAEKPVTFIAMGDMASNKPEQYGVSYQMGQVKPDFIIALGDIVYPGGRVLQYMSHFFPCYNDVATPGPKTGAPLMATIPVYPVVGNHDADMQRMPDYPDAYSCFYWFSVPKNGPGAGPWNVPLGKNETVAAAFRAAAGAEYPAMSNYSFDYGPAHFLVLDANSYAMKENDKIFPWIEKDLTTTKQKWKFVCFHQPAFHTSREHYTEQKMRLLQPLFERTGVDIVLAGHVHNYQRSMPLKFVPGPGGRDKRGRVNGTLTVDHTFDGVKDTTPEGVIHIVSGGGGAKLYSVDLAKTVEYLEREHPGNYQPLTAKYVAEHGFTVFDLTPSTLVLRQINITGKEVDRIKITK